MRVHLPLLPPPRLFFTIAHHPIPLCCPPCLLQVDTLDPPVPPGFGSRVLTDAAGAAIAGFNAGGFELR